MSSGHGRDGLPTHSNPYGSPLSPNTGQHHSRNTSLSGQPLTLPSNAHSFGTPQRQQAGDPVYAAGSNVHSPYTPSSSQPPRYPSQQDSLSNQAPNIHFQQATPQGSQHTSPSANHVPDTLTPGGAPRSTPYQAAGSASATLPSNNNAPQHYVPPPRAGILGSSHSHSKSSPIGLEQRYMPFSNTTPSATPTSATRMFAPQTPSGGGSGGPISYSPLGLSDIRPPAGDLGIDLTGTGSAYEVSTVQTNSNYLAPWPAYAFDWCKWPVSSGGSCGKMALGSYLEDPHNFLQILDTQIVPQEGPAYSGGPQYGVEYTKIAEATCTFPVTRVSWEPPSSQKQSTDLLATSGDHLRLWSLPPSQPSNVTSNINRSSAANTREAPTQKLLPLALLSNSKTPEHTAPLTSLDWNTLSPKLIITSSIDTTCTIWDIPTLTAKTQLIAHDKEVFDVRFCAGSVDVFVSCGADGSVRMFDLRSLEHSTIIYEPSEKSDKDKVMSPVPGSPSKGSSNSNANASLTPSPPLLRLAASPHDAHLLATFATESNVIRILDVRQPGSAIIELHGHSAALNSIEWSPSRRGMLASGGDDSLVLIWDLLNATTGTGGAGGAASSGGLPNGGAPPGGAAGGAAGGAGGVAVVAPGQGADVPVKTPTASWRCPYEVNNIGWAPQSVLTSQGGDWLGVSAGRGLWSVKL